MRTQSNRRLVVGLLVFLGLSLLQQCAYFHKCKTEPELIKPRPIGGYETLSNAIHYPRSARELGIEGRVLVNALVSIEGLVIETRITEALDPELDKIVVNAVKRTAFEPALRKGKPASVWISIPFVFSLSEWNMKNSPFQTFEMFVRPSPSFKNFDVEIFGKIKDDLELPLRIECLLPYNFEQTWVKASGEVTSVSGTVIDESGEWFVFQVSERELSFGFSYKQLEALKQNQFQYKFAMNHALPDWLLAVISESPKLRFSQNPDRSSENEDGTTKFEFNLKSLETYEPKYFEIEIEI